MLFNSLAFLLFLPAIWAIWNAVGPRRGRWVLLVGSYLFYAGWDPRFLPLLWLSTTLDWWVARRMQGTERVGLRRALLGLSLAVNLGVLIGFKYLPMILALLGIQDWDAARQTQGFHVYGHIPPGLSFYTFQTLSYTIDVYRGRDKATERWRDFAIYVAFFPQLLAGPVVRSHAFMPQLLADRRPTAHQLVRGAELFALGMFKKVVVADNIGVIIDPVFADLLSHDAGTIALAAGLFAAQVYADFSGYTTMARGLGSLFGYELPRNFDSPWLQGSPMGYRRAWHITIGTWFRDYVYFPLGGSRGPWLKASANLILLWMLFGIWHGASPTFLMWGLYNGVAAVLWRLPAQLGLHVPDFPGKRAAGVVLTAFYAVPAYLFFRTSTVSEGFVALGRLVTWNPEGAAALQGGAWVLAALFAVHTLAWRFYDEDLLWRLSWPGRVALLAAATAAMVWLGTDQRPFIYFQF